MKILLAGASLETNNMGVNALAVGAITCAVSAINDAELALLDYGKNRAVYTVSIGDRNVRIPLMPIRFSKKFYLKNNVAYLIILACMLRIIPSKYLKRHLLSKNKELLSLSAADMVAAISGGDSFSDIYGLRRLLYVSLPQLLALALDKDLVLLPQTIGPFQGKAAKKLAQWIMGRAKLVYCRDYAGLNEARKLLKKRDDSKKIRFCYDVGFVVEPTKPEHITISGLDEINKYDCLVGLNVSGLLYMGGYKQNNMFGLTIDYSRFIEQVVSYLIEQKGVHVLMIPHVFGADEHGESDTVACRKVMVNIGQKYRGRLGLAEGEYNQSEIKFIIGTCEFFVGSRMHACIAALSQNIPAVAIAYSKKFRGVFETADAGYLVADPRKMSSEDILAMIGDVFDQRADVKSRLEKKIPEVKAKVMNLFGEIREELYTNRTYDSRRNE